MRSAWISALVVAWSSVRGQTAAAQLRFEVASIKPSAAEVGGMFLRPLPGGNLRMTGATVKNLIAFAYDAREFAISGGPDWVNSERFDIDARVGDSEGTPQQIRERLKALLSERFQLAIHVEKKEQNVYALVVAKNGPKLRESKPDARQSIRKRGGSIIGEGVGIRMLALNLANSVDRPVLDKTGLTGRYDFLLEWSTDAAPDATGPSLFSALQEQLGLRLEGQKALTERLVIHHVVRPSEN